MSAEVPAVLVYGLVGLRPPKYFFHIGPRPQVKGLRPLIALLIIKKMLILQP